MPFPQVIQAIRCFLELRSSRKFVGQLTQGPEGYTFTYSDAYLFDRNVIPLGPEMPHKKRISLKNTFCSLF